MKVLVIGATGRTGRHVLAGGVQRGHHLTAFTRRPELLGDTSVPAAVVTGDGRDAAAVRSAVTGVEAVIAIVAAASRTGPHHTAEVARVLTAAMGDAGVRRLVITSAYPLVGQRPRLPMVLLRRIFAAAYADAAAMERHVTATDLDWTIVRLNRLTDRPGRGDLTLSRQLLDRPTAISRTDAAAILLDLAETGSYAGAAVNVTTRSR